MFLVPTEPSSLRKPSKVYPSKRRLRIGHGGRERQSIERRGCRQAHEPFMHPAAFLDRRFCISDDYSIAHDRSALRNVSQGDLVRLRDCLQERQAEIELRAGRQTTFIDDNRHIVLRMDLDTEGMTVFHYFSLTCARSSMMKGAPRGRVDGKVVGGDGCIADRHSLLRADMHIA